MSCICHCGTMFFNLGTAINKQLESKLCSSLRIDSLRGDVSGSDKVFIEHLMVDLYKLNMQAYDTMYLRRTGCQDNESAPLVDFKDLKVSKCETVSSIQIIKDLENILYQACDYMDAKNQADPLFDNMEWADKVYKTAQKLLNIVREWYIINLPAYEEAKWKS